jgi:NADPH:quinone reductase-like Zn-dependent oxidoreductase
MPNSLGRRLWLHLEKAQPKIVALDFATAAALPTAGSTALQIIRDVITAKPGMSILIHGAAGGVGS